MVPEESLLRFGFTALEAQLYCALLRQAPASGYRLAKTLGKAQANVYQGLAVLLRKGAVLADDSAARAFRPVPPAELLAALERDFEASKREAARALAEIERPPEGDHIYQLNAAAPLRERALRMLADAEEIILFDLFPGPYALLREALAAAAGRGVVVAGILYETLESPPPFTVVGPGCGPDLAPRWPGEQLTLVIDGREHLIALLGRDDGRVLRGLWSDSAYLTCLQHNGLAAEIRAIDLAPGEDDRLAPLSLLRAYPAGLAALLEPALEPA